jgi:2-keto-4-pentenoate hydratase/2-oxohepta-3-ene-1,7-dioic acid hydratase in catechol pathway
MRIVRFQRPDETIGWGLLTSVGIQDISSADPTLPTSTLELIERWERLLPRIQRLSNRLGESENLLRLLCPLDRVGKVLCIGLNYRDHAAEAKMEIPAEPIVFCKTATSVIGPGEDILLPKICNKVDYEAELVIVMGRKVHHADEATAASGIFGYTAGHDVSARDWQLDKPGKQWFLGKSFDSFAPLGPAIVDQAGLGDPMELNIALRLNGQTMQQSNTREMVFGPARLVSYLSHVMTLHCGDVIFTGTPPGVGMARNPPRYLADGDQVEIEIEGIGTLVNRCKAESR